MGSTLRCSAFSRSGSLTPRTIISHREKLPSHNVPFFSRTAPAARFSAVRQVSNRTSVISACGLKSIFDGMFGSESGDYKNVKSLHELKAMDIDKAEFDFAETKGKVLMIVNVASK
uniref:Glutathione peroxidase n=1 Tax=Tetraselmis sp. GSL018 TaxID=582737 RepID=A0A061SA34_9CHLO